MNWWNTYGSIDVLSTALHPMSMLKTLDLRSKNRRQLRRLGAGLGAGSGAFAVIGAFSGSNSTVTVGCGVTSGVLSTGAALLMYSCSSDEDIECGQRNLMHEEEHIDRSIIARDTQLTKQLTVIEVVHSLQQRARKTQK
ncbi:hypothetical protein PM082_022472 [Marasmius tenuissimus]|nr:hypothetical protein PM082_022472 [Marasmius tenuissimus]